MGYSDVGCYGGEIATPHINRLADGGLRFSQFYNCARCCPTRASLLTGAYPHRVGLADNGRTMSPEAPTLADRLKAAGYETAMAGKWHLSELAATDDEQQRIRWMNHQQDLGIPFADKSTYPIRRGFDRYYGVIWGVVNFFDPFSLVEGDRPVADVPDDFYLTDAITDYAVRTIGDFAKTDEPFFLYVAHTAPHWPIHARPEDIAKYQGRYDAGWDALRKQRFERQVELGLFDDETPLDEVITRGPQWDERSKREQAYLADKMEVHAAMVDRVDQGVGRILAALEETDQLDDTLIFFLSDNGASPEIPGQPGYDRYAETRDGRRALREAQLQQADNRIKLGSDESYTGIGPAWANAVNTPLRYWKKESYEGGCRTPLIVHWPAGLKTQNGAICRQVGHVMDIAPTCLELAGVDDAQADQKHDFAMDGKPLTPLLRGKSRQGHETLFFEHAGGKGARRGDWKIAALGRGDWELFNLAVDPGETSNLANEHPDLLRSLTSSWRAWHEHVTNKPAAGDTQAKTTDENRQPNIVLVFIDDMGWGDFSCFGNQAVETQNIDRLAREGLRFEQFYVNSPICSPSRTAISTGQYPQRWRISSYLAHRQLNKDRGMAQWLDPRAPMLARSLKQAGYATGHFGKWHMGGQRDVGEAPLITAYGFDKSLANFEGLGPRVLPLCDAHDGKPPRKHALGSDNLGRGPIVWEDRSKVTASFTSAAIDFIRQAESKGQPFYVNVWPDDVHSPFFPPEARRGDEAKRTLYHGVLDTMDEQLGKLFDLIRNSDTLRDNTLILVCSDNGPELGAGSAGKFRGFKTQLYEGGVRSPLIAWGPGLIDKTKTGSFNRTSFLAAIDLAPSLLAIAGADPPADVKFDGQALPDVLLGKSPASRDAPVFFRRPPDRDAFYGDDDLPDLAVRDGRWKLLCEYDGSDAELYDLDADPSETKNLAADHGELVSQLTESLLAWHKSLPADNGATFKPAPRRPAKK